MLTHPTIFRGAVHDVVRVGTSGRAVDPEKMQGPGQVTKTQRIPTEYKINPGFTNVILLLAKLKSGLLAHVTASVEPQRLLSDRCSETTSIYHEWSYGVLTVW